MQDKKIRSTGNEKGAVVLIMAIALVALIGVGSLAVDIGSALVTKAELQNVADASALSATRELGLIYKASQDTTGISSSERSRVAAKAVQYAAANEAAGMSISVPDGDICVGQYDHASGAVTCTNQKARATQITARRDDTANGTVATTLGRVLGIDQISVSATSAAALYSLGTLNSGEGEFPIGLDEDWFDHHDCVPPDSPPGQLNQSKITLYPTDETSCAGWHTFTTKPASASQLKRILTQMTDGTFKSPETIAGETYYNFIGGHIDSRVQDLEDYHNNVKGGQPWDTTVPVYESSACANPNQARLIVGFARVKVLKVIAHKAHPASADEEKGKITVAVTCGVFTEGEIGNSNGNAGGDYGTLVDTPGMIQ